MDGLREQNVTGDPASEGREEGEKRRKLSFTTAKYHAIVSLRIVFQIGNNTDTSPYENAGTGAVTQQKR